MTLYMPECGNENFNSKQKENIVILGDSLDQTGSTSASVEYNLGREDAHFFKHRHLLGNPALPVGKRLKAWSQSTSTVALYCASTWHVTAKVLSDLRTWELQKLRRLLRLRRRPDEDQFMYNDRTSKTIRKWLDLVDVVPERSVLRLVLEIL